MISFTLEGTFGASNWFTPSHVPPCILLSTDFRRAKYLGGSVIPFVRVFLFAPSTTFKVRILSSSREHLHVGYCQPFSPTPLRFNSVAWFMCRADTQLFECGKHGPVSAPETRITAGTLVSVEKDSRKCALRFQLNGMDIVDAHGKPFGWRATGLSSEDFEELVGVVEFHSQSPGDEVLIVD